MKPSKHEKNSKSSDGRARRAISIIDHYQLLKKTTSPQK
jgi:hypothetical protein